MLDYSKAAVQETQNLVAKLVPNAKTNWSALDATTKYDDEFVTRMETIVTAVTTIIQYLVTFGTLDIEVQCQIGNVDQALHVCFTLY